MLEEERLLWWLRGEEAHQIVPGGRRGVVSWWHGLTIRDIEVFTTIRLVRRNATGTMTKKAYEGGSLGISVFEEAEHRWQNVG